MCMITDIIYSDMVFFDYCHSFQLRKINIMKYNDYNIREPHRKIRSQSLPNIKIR